MKPIHLIVLGALLGACSHVSPDYELDGVMSVRLDATHAIATHDVCPISTEDTDRVAIAPILVGAAVGAGIDLLAGALDQASKAGETPAIDMVHINTISSAADFPNCIFLWRGKIRLLPVPDNTRDFAAGQAPAWFAELGLEEAVGKSPKVLSLWTGLASSFARQGFDIRNAPEPEFLLQARLIQGIGPEVGTAVKLVPDFVYWRAPIEKVAFAPATRNVTIGLGVAKPAEEHKTTVVMPLGNLKPGDAFWFNLDSRLSTVPQGCGTVFSEQTSKMKEFIGAKDKLDADNKAPAKDKLEPTERAKIEMERDDAKTVLEGLSSRFAACSAALSKQRYHLESNWFGVPAPAAKGARVITASVTEIRHPSAAAAFAAKLLTGAKDGLVDAAKAAVTPPDAAAVLDARSAYETQRGVAIGALNLCITGEVEGSSSDVNRSVGLANARAAIATMNAKALAGNIPQVAQPETVGDCQSILESLS